MSELKDLIHMALEEDLGIGDITTDAVVSPEQKGRGEIRAKQSLVVAGLDIAKKVFRELDVTIHWEMKSADGSRVSKGTPLAVLEGRLATLLKGERVALNFLQRLCGIATLTDQFAKRVEGTRAVILDTRKTTPGWRSLEKYAVRIGGANNHRFGLFDRYLIKNNHITAAGSLSAAVHKVLAKKKPGVLIEVEARHFKEVQEALELPVDIILLDNFSVSEVSKAVALVGKKVKLEVSGGITLDNVAQYAATGIDFISVGALTHSAPAADIHMLIV